VSNLSAVNVANWRVELTRLALDTTFMNQLSQYLTIIVFVVQFAAIEVCYGTEDDHADIKAEIAKAPR